MIGAEIPQPALKIHDPPLSEENLQLIKILNEQDKHRVEELGYTVENVDSGSHEGWMAKVTDTMGTYNDKQGNRICAVHLSLNVRLPPFPSSTSGHQQLHTKHN